MPIKPFRRVMAANRSEIAIRIFRACTELGIPTVGIYSKEDRGALHRYKADETYSLPENRNPLKAYLDIDAIVQIARQRDVDAIHPGYGFLSENADFARACAAAGIVFIGPSPEVLDAMGDKTAARRSAQTLGIPIIPGTDGPAPDSDSAAAWAAGAGYPVILKASFGGGGRGMRVAHNESEMLDHFTSASREAEAAFGRGDIFLEKYLPNPRHIEVQILADSEGNTIHLFERDCSVQRRHQKVIEIAPSPSIHGDLREKLCSSAVQLARSVGYTNAGTIEFLVDEAGNHYFIEMNPRIQVEHTITELITGIDIVKTQIRIAEGYALADPLVGLPNQEAVQMRGYAIQSRVTTEDASNNFLPDYGRITHYRSAAGFGIRLDGGTAFTGAVITPFYDSLLVKVSAWSLTFEDVCNRLSRALSEFRVRGVKTNIPFVENVIRHPTFRAGNCTTTFIEQTPELFQLQERADRASKVLEFIGTIVVNGNPQVAPGSKPARLRSPVIPERSARELPKGGDARSPRPPEGTRNILKRLGPDLFAIWVLDQQRLLVTDTTLRDAHQSLLATRLRTLDMLRVADSIAHDLSGLFSLEMWGGATFDVTMRFLWEDPWDRLAALREHIPNILFQMLLRGANAVGYSNYPDNVVREFVRVAAREGIDLFRVFDSLNYVPAMVPAIEAVRDVGAIAEAAICYTGDLLDPHRPKYNLNYYLRLAKQLEAAGAQMLAIKDMAGLCRPYAALELVKALKQEVGIPVHFHTHDTAGGQVASLLFAAEAGVDIVDTAISSMAGMTSQPSMEALVAALQHQPRDTGIQLPALHRHADYWQAVREYYAPFESDLKSPAGDVYVHEIPGGQYSNLRPQAEAMGVGDRLPELKQMYAVVNQMLGDIVKVTPSSKVVGDLALYMLTHDLTPDDVIARGEEIQFPESVVGFFAGDIGYPEGGFPEHIQKAVLKGRLPALERAGASLPAADFEAIQTDLNGKIGRTTTEMDLLSYLMYPSVFTTFASHRRKYGDVSCVPTEVFFYGMVPGEETELEIEEGKILFIKLVGKTEPDLQGMVSLFYELNGHPREVKVADASVTVANRRPKANPDDLHHVGSPMPGAVLEIAVKPGITVEKDELLVVIEAMKVQMNINSPVKARVREVLVKSGDHIDTGDLLILFE